MKRTGRAGNELFKQISQMLSALEFRGGVSMWKPEVAAISDINRGVGLHALMRVPNVVKGDIWEQMRPDGLTVVQVAQFVDVESIDAGGPLLALRMVLRKLFEHEILEGVLLNGEPLLGEPHPEKKLGAM